MLPDAPVFGRVPRGVVVALAGSNVDLGGVAACAGTSGSATRTCTDKQFPFL
jgi:hypothetical protein